MIIANYGLQAKIITDVTEDNIKKELAQNHLVLLPANGQLLGNPNYKTTGPKISYAGNSRLYPNFHYYQRPRHAQRPKLRL